MLLVLHKSTIARRSRFAAILVAAALLAGACGSDGPDQAEQLQVIAVTPTPLATTPPLTVPPPSPVPTPTLVPVPVATSTPVPTATTEPTATPTAQPVESEAAADINTDEQAEAAEAPTVEATAAPAVAETPTPLPTAIPTVEPTVEPDTTAEPEPTASPTVAAAPTAIVVSGEPPLECYDPVVFVYRGFVEGVDELSFEGGKVSCVGAGTNGVAADRSYRHGSGLVIQRNANYVFNQEGTGYIPYSGTMHFCLGGQTSSAAFRADTVPALLIVIDNEARAQVGRGAVGPASFDNGGARC